jgi:hypothetical protein
LLTVDVDTFNLEKKIRDAHVTFTKSQKLMDMQYCFELPGVYENINQDKIPTRKEPEASLVSEVLEHLADGSISTPAQANKYYFEKK